MGSRRGWVTGAVAATALVAAACGSSGQSPAHSSASTHNSASAPGVTATSVTIGMIASVTGSAAPNNTGMTKGAEARFDAQNALGGVDGRKITLAVKDDTSTPSGDATAAQVLVNSNAFAVIGESPFLFGGYRVLQQAGVPVVGGGYDGPEWGQQPNTDMFSFGGINGSVAGTDPSSPVFTTYAQFIKDQGGTNVASFGYGESPSSADSAKGMVRADSALGLKTGLLDTSIPFGSVNAGPIALQMKQANVDAAYLPMDNNTNFAIVTAAKQAGVNMKVALSATGYGHSLLADPSAVAAADNSYFLSLCRPVEAPSSATKAMQANLAKYARFTGVPGFSFCQGYVSADLIIKGLELAGHNPTRQSFMTGLRGVTNYSAGGLLPNPADFSMSQFGKAPATACAYFVQLQGTKFVPVPADGKPVCGKLLASSTQG